MQVGWWRIPGHAETGNQMWERACSRMRRVSQHMHQLAHRIREQARSHI